MDNFGGHSIGLMLSQVLKHYNRCMSSQKLGAPSDPFINDGQVGRPLILRSTRHNRAL